MCPGRFVMFGRFGAGRFVVSRRLAPVGFVVMEPRMTEPTQSALAPDGAGPLVRFYRMIEGAPAPHRADRAAGGTLPTRAARYCDAVTAAAAFGWWVYPPMDFSLLWDGEAIHWTYAGQTQWLPLDAAQFPYLGRDFDAAAPAALRGGSPPFLTALAEPGVVQVWTGLLARTAPGWSLLVRPPANLPGTGGYASYEGIVEADRWFGPLFTNIRLTRTDVPVRLRTAVPLLQVQPLPRIAYADATQAAMEVVPDMAAFAPQDWDDYHTSIVGPAQRGDRVVGQYGIAARRRRKAECPFAAAVA